MFFFFFSNGHGVMAASLALQHYLQGTGLVIEVGDGVAQTVG